MWDYKWFTIQQNPGSQIEGLREYREIQVIVLLTRFLAWGMTKWTQDAVFTMWISAFLGIISLIVSLFAARLTVGVGMVNGDIKGEIPTGDRITRFLR
jgi:hypothetical protein